MSAPACSDPERLENEGIIHPEVELTTTPPTSPVRISSPPKENTNSDLAESSAATPLLSSTPSSLDHVVRGHPTEVEEILHKLGYPPLIVKLVAIYDITTRAFLLAMMRQEAHRIGYELGMHKVPYEIRYRNQVSPQALAHLNGARQLESASQTRGNESHVDRGPDTSQRQQRMAMLQPQTGTSRGIQGDSKCSEMASKTPLSSASSRTKLDEPTPVDSNRTAIMEAPSSIIATSFHTEASAKAEISTTIAASVPIEVSASAKPSSLAKVSTLSISGILEPSRRSSKPETAREFESLRERYKAGEARTQYSLARNDTGETDENGSEGTLETAAKRRASLPKSTSQLRRPTSST